MLETQTTEYKREWSDKAKNTMLAFLNTDGGTLYIGIENDGSVYGVNGDIDLEMRRVATSFRDSVTPDPTGFFKVEPEQREGKYIIIVSVERGTSIPYCYLADGLVPQGVYVRVGSSTVMATREHIRKLIKDNSAEQFLNGLSFEQNLTFEYADKVFAEEEVKFGREQKLSLGLLRADGLYTNLALVLSDQCPYSTKAAIFEGLSKAKFKDRKEFSGSLFKQMDDVHEYLTVYNRTRSTFEGLYRIDHPDYPDIALREAFVNAVIHRDYYIEGSLLVSMYDNRVEFMSLGGVMPGVTYDLMLAGVSVTRNDRLANAFYRLNIIEAYGTGIPRIFDAYGNSGVKPEMPVINGGFLIRIPNLNYNFSETVSGATVQTNNNRLLVLFKDAAFKKEDAADALGLSVSGAYKLLQNMVANGQLCAKKAGRQWIYSFASEKEKKIPRSDYLKDKIVAFSGRFAGGTADLKFLVYFAGGAPHEGNPMHIDYLVVGDGGRDTKSYKRMKKMIGAGGIVELTEINLCDICNGRMSAPERKPISGIIAMPASGDGQKEAERQREELADAQRKAFAEKYKAALTQYE
jgi:ATP-dependent DNA helicase RecG